MSYDIQLVTARKPTLEIATAWAASQSGVRLRGWLDGSVGGLVLQRRSLLRWGDAALADGPVHADGADLPDALLSGVRQVRWLVEFHMAASQVDEGLPLVAGLARHFAEACDGAVFDPQEDRLIWPTAPVRKVVRRPEQRIRLLTMEWFLSPEGITTELPADLLAAIRGLCPEATPRRYGTFEPLQEKFDGDDAEANFASAWRAEGAAEYVRMLFWTATRPVIEGSVSFPDLRDDLKPAGVGRALRLTMSMDGSRLDADAAWLEKAVNLFRGLAARFDAIYAAAYIERNILLKRQIWYGPESEHYPFIAGPWFQGLPIEPTWLAWFGEPYRELVGSSLPTDRTVRIGDSLMVRWGDKPMDLDQLRDVPRLPATLTVRRVGFEYQPAEVVPVN